MSTKYRNNGDLLIDGVPFTRYRFPNRPRMPRWKRLFLSFMVGILISLMFFAFMLNPWV